ncbi:MAG TPA: helix-turn-helix domain-containing protein [Candidatus Eubacterium faecale]|uniref:Helix-turn-helix domain-containing protein n=1 Tax=Candidatus Eubacterium faecale TaxID=2838568 RepID=A0A9D2MII2_9FIRM|nr:helix-turn-helix domain-containing protein [Candidatus Eubacterium faecale]
MATTVFRVEKIENYTTISNYHLQDKNLSNKAKGLLTIMLSLPPNWDMTLKGLVSLSSDGIDAIRTTITELEKNGYLSRTRGRSELGQLQCTEYTIYEQPMRESEPISEDIQPPSDQIGKSDVAQVGKPDMDQIGKSNVVQIGKSDVDQIGFPYLGKPYLGKSNSINNLTNKDTYGINNYPSHQYHSEPKENKDKIDERKRAEKLLNERKNYEQIIKDNISYDQLIEYYDDEDFSDFINLAVDVMLDAVTTTKPTLRIKGQDYPAETVKSRLCKITDRELLYVWESLDNTDHKISNMQSYLLTAIYNSLHGAEVYYSQWVKDRR